MEFTDEMISKAAKVAERHVCDRCLGRQFAKVGTGMTNDVRGAMIREELRNRGIETSAEGPCPLCEDTFDMLDRFADAVADAVNSVESDNFLVGSRVEPEISKREKEMQAELELDECESIKTELPTVASDRIIPFSAINGEGAEIIRNYIIKSAEANKNAD